MRTSGLLAGLGLVVSIFGAGCFYPPPPQPLPPATDELTLDLPYDLAWDAVNNVVANNDFKVNARDPNSGVIEAQSPKFTLKDADCGKIKSVGGAYRPEPGLDASAVYNFYVKATGAETTRVSISATYIEPLIAPFHPPQELQCVSTGQAEAHLLEEVREQAAVTHRPEFAQPGQIPAAVPTPISGPGSIRNSVVGNGSPPASESGPFGGSGGAGQMFGAAPGSAPEPAPSSGGAVGGSALGSAGSAFGAPPQGPPNQSDQAEPAPAEGAPAPSFGGGSSGNGANGGASSAIPNLNSIGTAAPAGGGGSSPGALHLLPVPGFGSSPAAQPSPASGF